MRLCFGPRIPELCSYRIFQRDKLFLRCASTSAKRSKHSPKQEKKSQDASEGWKQLPGVTPLTEEILRDVEKKPFSPAPWNMPIEKPSLSPAYKKKLASSLPSDTPHSEQPKSETVNIWNEPVIDRRRQPTNTVNSSGFHDRIKSKITQAQKRLFDPNSSPAPASIDSLLEVPTQPAQSDLSSASPAPQPQPSSEQRDEQKPIQKQIQEQQQPKLQVNQVQPQTAAERDLQPSTSPLAYSHDSISENIPDKPKPRRPRPPTNANSLAATVPRLDCVSHTRAGSATRRVEWPASTYPQVCFVGRTNSGKSSLLNQFFRGRRLAKSSSRPGVTKALDFYDIDDKVTLVDTPGYGTNLNAQARHRWEGMVREYLKYSPNLKLVCLLMDITNLPTDDDLSILRLVQTRCGRQVSSTPPATSGKSEASASEVAAQGQTQDVTGDLHAGAGIATENLTEAGALDPNAEMAKQHPIPVLLILTKDDHVTHDQRSNLVHRIKRRLQWSGPFLCYSVKDRRGRGKLLRHIMTTLFQPENSILLQDMLRADFIPYGSAEHRGLLKKDNREAHWQIKQREETEAKKLGLAMGKRKAKKKPSQDGPVQLTEATF